METGNIELMFKQPFNAFLSGFSATVGQFVLTASLRIQTNPENEGEFGGSISHERYCPRFSSPTLSCLVVWGGG